MPKKIPGRPKVTSKKTDALMKREVLKHPSITAAELKEKHPDVLGSVSIMTVQHRRQKELKLPSHRAANPPGALHHS